MGPLPKWLIKGVWNKTTGSNWDDSPSNVDFERHFLGFGQR